MGGVIIEVECIEGILDVEMLKDQLHEHHAFSKV